MAAAHCAHVGTGATAAIGIRILLRQRHTHTHTRALVRRTPRRWMAPTTPLDRSIDRSIHLPVRVLTWRRPADCVCRPRSIAVCFGLCVLQNEAADTAYVMGGVALESKVKAKDASASNSKGAKKSSKSAGQSVQVPVTYSDLWAINLNNSSWSQVKKRGYFPATGRFAMGVAVQKEKQVRDEGTKTAAAVSGWLDSQ